MREDEPKLFCASFADAYRAWATCELIAAVTSRLCFVFVAQATSGSASRFRLFFRVKIQNQLLDSWLLWSATKHVWFAQHFRQLNEEISTRPTEKSEIFWKSRKHSSTQCLSNWKNMTTAIDVFGLWRSNSEPSDQPNRLLLLSDCKRDRFEASIWDSWQHVRRLQLCVVTTKRDTFVPLRLVHGQCSLISVQKACMIKFRFFAFIHDGGWNFPTISTHGANDRKSFVPHGSSQLVWCEEIVESNIYAGSVKRSGKFFNNVLSNVFLSVSFPTNIWWSIEDIEIFGITHEPEFYPKFWWLLRHILYEGTPSSTWEELFVDGGVLSWKVAFPKIFHRLLPNFSNVLEFIFSSPHYVFKSLFFCFVTFSLNVTCSPRHCLVTENKALMTYDLSV